MIVTMLLVKKAPALPKEIIENKYKEGSYKAKLERMLVFLVKYKKMVKYSCAFDNAGVKT